MPRLVASSFFLLGILLFSRHLVAQNGMYADAAHNFLIPLLENNVVKGHAYVYQLDQVSKDTNSFMLQVFDEYLRDVGEKKFHLDATFAFNSVVFNGTHIVTKFQRKQEAVRYLVFNQKAEQVFDTIIYADLDKRDPKSSERNFNPAPMVAVANQYVLDYLPVNASGHDATMLQYLGNDGQAWQYTDVRSHPSSMQLLAADNRYIVNAVYHFQPRRNFNDVQTYVQLFDTRGHKLGETLLFVSDSTAFYPISAEITANGIEVISEFTKRAHEYAKVKFGVSIHTFDFSGNIRSVQYNEFTKSMVKDTAFKKYKLLVHSYLYMHKAVKLQNGNWLVAGEQLLRTRLRIRLTRNRYIVYNKKNICLLELDDHAGVVGIHVEKNKDDGIRLPPKYYRRPQQGAMLANARGRMDINYFVRSEEPGPEQVAFVFTDYNYHSGKLALGNLLYKNGDVKVDRFNIPHITRSTRIGVFPARFGHALLIRYDPATENVDFDNIKFNN